MQAQAKEVAGNQAGHMGSMDNVVDKGNEKFGDQVLKVWPLDRTYLQNTSLFMSVLQQKLKPLKLPSFPKYTPQRPSQSLESFQEQERQRLGSFQGQESVRLLDIVLGLDAVGNSIGSFQDQERVRLQTFQEQERLRLQVEAEALKSFQGQEKLRLETIFRSLDAARQSLKSFQEKERLRLEIESRALQSFQNQEKLRMGSILRALNAIGVQKESRANLYTAAGEVATTAATASSKATGPRSRLRQATQSRSPELFDQTSPDVKSISTVALIGFFVGSGIIFAMLHSRCSASTTEDPVLSA